MVPLHRLRRRADRSRLRGDGASPVRQRSTLAGWVNPAVRGVRLVKSLSMHKIR